MFPFQPQQKLDYEYLANAGFQKSHVDLAYSQTRNPDPNALINWMLDNPEEKFKQNAALEREEGLKAKLQALKKHLEETRALQAQNELSKEEPKTKKLPSIIALPYKEEPELSKQAEPLSPIISKADPIDKMLQKIALADNGGASLPLKIAKKEMLDKVVNAAHKDYNIWLSSLADEISKMKFDGLKYKTLIEEMKKKSHREISLLLNNIFGSVSMILRQSIQNQGEYKDLDLNTFFYLMNILYDMKTFTKAQRKSVIKQYEAYCGLKELKVNQLFVDRILERGFFESQKSEPVDEKKGLEIAISNGENGDAKDIDVSEVDDDTKEFSLTDAWFENFKKEMEALKDPVLMDSKESISKAKELNLKEKQFTGQVLESGLTDREACVVCMQKMRAFLFMPCKHFLTCQDCTNAYKECPVCDKLITQRVLLYWS